MLRNNSLAFVQAGYIKPTLNSSSYASLGLAHSWPQNAEELRPNCTYLHRHGLQQPELSLTDSGLLNPFLNYIIR